MQGRETPVREGGRQRAVRQARARPPVRGPLRTHRTLGDGRLHAPMGPRLRALDKEAQCSGCRLLGVTSRSGAREATKFCDPATVRSSCPSSARLRAGSVTPTALSRGEASVCSRPRRSQARPRSGGQQALPMGPWIRTQSALRATGPESPLLNSASLAGKQPQAIRKPVSAAGFQ